MCLAEDAFCQQNESSSSDVDAPRLAAFFSIMSWSGVNGCKMPSYNVICARVMVVVESGGREEHTQMAFSGGQYVLSFVAELRRVYRGHRKSVQHTIGRKGVTNVACRICYTPRCA